MQRRITTNRSCDDLNHRMLNAGTAGALLLPVASRNDVPAAYRTTAIADLLAYHNGFGEAPSSYTHPAVLVGMCMDHRKKLRIPDKFAYVMRAAGANFTGMEFQMSFAIAVGGVRAVAIIGHDQCGMSGLAARKDAFVANLVGDAGWNRDAAVQHFDQYATRFEIGDPAEFTRAQVRLLRSHYPKLTIAPLLYRLGDGLLHVIDETGELVHANASDLQTRTAS